MEGKPYTKYDDEISLRDVLVGLKSLILWVRQYWLVLGLTMLIGIGAALLWRARQEPTYTATTTLMLSDDGRASISSLTGILGQLGIAAPSGKYNIDKLLEISRSRRIIEQVLFQRIEMDGSTDYWANHCISTYELDQKWSINDEPMTGFRFSSDDVTEFDVVDNYALKKLYLMIVGVEGDRGLLDLDYGREHYVMSYSMTSLSDTLSVEFVKRHFDAVKEFYVTKAVEKQQQTYDLVVAKRDSIQRELVKVDSRIAALRDRSLGSYANSASVQLSQLSTQSLIYKQALAEAEKNLAIAELALETNTPLIQQIDTPIYPIAPQSPSLFRILILGCILGLGIFFVYLLVRYMRAL